MDIMEEVQGQYGCTVLAAPEMSPHCLTVLTLLHSYYYYYYYYYYYEYYFFYDYYSSALLLQYVWP